MIVMHQIFFKEAKIHLHEAKKYKINLSSQKRKD
jgi:hypothetical protein